MASNADEDTQLLLPASTALERGRASIVSVLPTTGSSLEKTQRHIQEDLVPAFSKSSTSPRYYGFVTGGATPAAKFADHIAVDADQNVQVHLPGETVATDVEDAALRMLCQLFDLDEAQWLHRTFTTGATASNTIGLALGRQAILNCSVAELGLVRATKQAGIEDIQVLTTTPHSSLKKAASVVGIGRSNVIDVSREDMPHRFDLVALEQHLSKPGIASIVAVSCAEVNTGFFATNEADMRAIRKLCNQRNAWLHVDAAFGAMARLLPDELRYEDVRAGVAGLELANSIAGDAHKLVNVPYDCGFLFSKSLEMATEVFKNANAAYLSTTAAQIPSPLNIGLENSRRFRALPVYASLITYGQSGYRNMIERQVQLAQAISAFISDHTAYELLPEATNGNQAQLSAIYIVVLFRAKREELNKELVSRINETRRIYVSGTVWNGLPAARFAVANWQVDVEGDMAVIKDVLMSVLQ